MYKPVLASYWVLTQFINQIINPDIKNLPTGYFFSFFLITDFCNLTAWIIEFFKI
jgi:hypothetical protein